MLLALKLKEEVVRNPLIVSALVLLLAGCSTSPNNMRKSGPDEVHTSFKDAKQVALCIGGSWEDLAVVSSRETEKGYSVTGLLRGKLHYLADIDNHESGSQTKLYKFMSHSIGRDPFFGGAAECQ